LRSKYNVIIIPGELSETQIIEGHRNGTVPPEFAGGIGEAGVQNLRDFVNEGGTLVTMDKATEFAAKQFALPVKNALEGAKPQDFYVPGSLLKIVLDTENPIAYGMPRETAAFVEQNALMSGWILGESKIFGKTAVVDVPVGRGRIILLSIRPQFRAQVRGTYKLLFNSLYYGPATLTVYE